MQVSVGLEANSKTLQDFMIRVLTRLLARYQFLQPRTYYDAAKDGPPDLEWAIRWIEGKFLWGDSFAD